MKNSDESTYRSFCQDKVLFQFDESFLLQIVGSKFSEMPIHMGLSRHIGGSDSTSNTNLDSMGTYTTEDPPQDEPGIYIIMC